MKTAPEKIWMNGRLIPWEAATTHVMSHALHYGSSVFEGIRSYATCNGPKFFRLEDHIDRLMASARIYRMPPPHGREELIGACHDVVAANALEAAYLRPIAYRGYGSLGIDPHDIPVDVVVVAVEWGAYYDAERKRRGLDACMVSWQRPAPNTIPAMAKAGGNYLSGQLIAGEARCHGFDEGIALDVDGYVCEGSGMNVFAVKDGVLFTPPATSSILPGLTRDTVLELCERCGLEVRTERIVRELLTIADEMFLVGTAAEITPVRSLDRQRIGKGVPGPVTTRLQRAFADLIEGRSEDPRGHMTGLRMSKTVS